MKFSSSNTLRRERTTTMMALSCTGRRSPIHRLGKCGLKWADKVLTPNPSPAAAGEGRRFLRAAIEEAKTG
jgi:hypothetical protein